MTDNTFSFNPIEDGFDYVTKAIISLYRTDDELSEKFAEALIALREDFKERFIARDLWNN